MMKTISPILCLVLVCLSTSLVAGTVSFSTTSGVITELTLPWTRQGDTLKARISISNTDAISHSVLVSLSEKYGVKHKSGSPLFFMVGGRFADSFSEVLPAGATKEFTLYHVPGDYRAGRFMRYINVYQNSEFQSRATLPITVHSALTLRARNFREEELVDLLNVPAVIPECVPVYFHNDSSSTQLLTEFLSVNLPGWITIQNKFSYPLVVLPNDVINFGNITVAAPEPNIEKLEGPVYLIYKTGNTTHRTGISLYITSAKDTAALKPCIEFQLDSHFGPVKIGNSVTKELRIRSNRNVPIRIAKPQFTWGDAEAFSFNADAFPIDVPPFGEVSTQISFTPTTIDPFVKYRYAVDFTARAESDSITCDPGITFAGVAYLTEAVEPVPDGNVRMSILPNPFHDKGNVLVEGLRDAEIMVYDFLGNKVAEGRGTAIELRHSQVYGSGVYIVKATGIDASGTNISLVRSFIVLK